MIWKKRQGLGRVGPLGEALAPPDIVFRGGVKLRKMEGDDACFAGHVLGVQSVPGLEYFHDGLVGGKYFK